MCSGAGMKAAPALGAIAAEHAYLAPHQCCIIPDLSPITAGLGATSRTLIPDQIKLVAHRLALSRLTSHKSQVTRLTTYKLLPVVSRYVVERVKAFDAYNVTRTVSHWCTCDQQDEENILSTRSACSLLLYSSSCSRCR